MHQLRTPKTLPGPEQGNPSLGFRAWYETLNGAAAFDALDRIPREAWADYLEWFQQTTDAQVRYRTRLLEIEPVADVLRLHLESDGARHTATTRKLILANGYAGAGGPNLPKEYWHTVDPFVAMATAAAVTKTLKVATGICLLVERDPITTAKEVASVDHLSGGRVIFGIGGGWNAEEMGNHGTPFKERWKILRERVHGGGGSKPFGELTAGEVAERAAELRSATGWGPTARVGPVARAWADLAREMEAAGAAKVADLDPELVARRAEALWIVPPGGSLL